MTELMDEKGAINMQAETTVEFVGLPSPERSGLAGWGAHPLQGRYFRPLREVAHTAFVVAHYNLDFCEHYLGPYLSKRGYGFLGWNTRYRGNEMYFSLDNAVADIGAAINWLRQSQHVDTVVLLGNSGGASLMAAYQSQATHHNLKPGPYSRLNPAIQELSPAELFISLTAHPGRSDLIASCIDPSVVDENDPFATDKNLDMYSAENGPPYSLEFQRRYRAAQLARNRKISSWARAELERIADMPGPGRDRLFIVPRLWADLRYLDGDIEPSDRPIPGCWSGDPQKANRGVAGIGIVNTLRTWLSMWSIDDSQARMTIHGPNISVPSLVIDASADSGVFESDTSAIFESLGTTDKERHTVTGDHYLQGDRLRSDVADMIAEWVAARS
jgi:hypothetical protein